MISCSCLNADCSENGIDISVDFRQSGSTQIMSLEGVDISIRSENNSSVSYRRVISTFSSDERGIIFFAVNDQKYFITIDNDTTVDIEIETKVESEDECCELYGIEKAKINGVDTACDEECQIFKLFTITL